MRPERPQHHRSGRQIADVGEVELDRTVSQAPLERVQVAAIEPAGDDERERRAADGDKQQRRFLQGRHEEDDRADEAGPRRISDAVEADIDERLRSPPFFRSEWGVEQLVSRFEQRRAEHRFAAAHDGRARCSVVDGKEAQQPVAASKRRDRLCFEEVVDRCRSDRSEHDQRRKTAQIWRHCQRA